MNKNINLDHGQPHTLDSNQQSNSLFINGIINNQTLAITLLPHKSQIQESIQETGTVTIVIKYESVNEQVFSCQINAPYKSCLVPKDKVQQNQTFPLKIQLICGTGECSFKLYLTQQRAPKFDTKAPTQIDFNKFLVLIVSLDLPKSFERVVLDIDFQDKYSPVNESQIHFSQGKKSVIAEEEHIVVAFERSSSLSLTPTCEDCVIEGVLISDFNSSAVVQAFQYFKNHQIKQNQLYVDFAKKNKETQYSVSLDDNDFDYIKINALYVKEYSQSSLRVYANLDEKPDSLDKNFWNIQFQNSLAQDDGENQKDSQINKEYSIIILKSQFKTGKILYLSLVSQIQASLFFEVKTLKFSTKPLHININEINSGVIESKQVHAYKLNFTEYQDNLLFSIRFYSEVGQADLYIAPYTSIQDYNKQIKEIESSAVARVQNSEKYKNFEFKPSCKEKKKEDCLFILYIVSTQNDGPQKSQFYKIEESFIQDSNVRLVENQAKPSFIKRGINQYYVYYIEDYKSILSVKISVSAQNMELFASLDANCKTPNLKCKSIVVGSSRKPIIYKKKQLKGLNAIYIGIEAIRHQEFTISILVQRAKQDTILKLLEGIGYTSQIKSKSDIQFYRYDGELRDNEDLEINIFGAKDKLLIMVNSDGQLPDQNGFQWISRNNFLYINHTKDKDFVRKGTYYIAITSSENSLSSGTSQYYQKLDANNYADLQYKIMISTSQTIKVLDLNEPFFDTVLPYSTKYYEVHVNPLQQTVFMNRNILSSDDTAKDLVFYIGNETHEEQPDKYQFKLVGGDAATFELEGKYLSKLCLPDDTFCQIFIAVENFGPIQAQYTLTVWEKDLAIELQEGYQHSYTLYHIDSFMYFYYIPSHKDISVNFFMYSYYGRTNFTVNLWKKDAKLNLPSTWPFPKKDESQKDEGGQYTSAYHNSHSITLNTKSLQACWPDCIILISVSFLEEDEYDEEQAKEWDDQFTLIASTLFNDIRLGDRLEFTLDNQESKYFFYELAPLVNAEQLVKKNASLICSLTSLSGKGLIAASIRDDKNQRMPIDIVQSDFISYNNHLEIPLTKIKKIIKKQNLKYEDNPTLVLEIMSYGSTGKFVLSLYDSLNVQINLLHGVPVDFNVKPKSSQSFYFFNYFKSDLQFRFSREIGFGNMSIIICSDKDPKLCEKNEDADMSKFMSGASGNLLTVSQDSENFCQYCYYIINIQNFDDSVILKGYLYALIDNDAIWLQEGKSIVDNNEKQEVNLYRLSVPSSEETEISLIAYNGNPEIYINYNYETNYTNFYDGPFKMDNKDKSYINLRIPARDELMTTDNKFKPYNKQVSFLNTFKDSVSDLSDTFLETEIYVIVRNPDKNLGMNYSIGFTAGEIDKFLYDGQMLYQNLDKGDSVNLTYQYFDDEQPAVLTINVQNSKDCSLDGIQLTAELNAQNTFYDTPKHNITQIQLQQVTRKDPTITFGFPSDKGSYKLVVENKNQKTCNLSIYINTKDMTLVPLKSKIEHLLVQNSINYYEFFVPKKGVIGLDLIHCTGKMSMGISQNYNKFIQKDYDSLMESIPGNTYHDPIPVNKGPLYIAFQSQDNEAFYTLQANWYKSSSDIRRLNINAGDQGEVIWGRDRENNAMISFKPLVCNGCTKKELEQSKVIYEVFISKDEEIMNVIGKCGAQNYFDHDQEQMQQFLKTTKLNPKDFMGDGVAAKSFPLNLQKDTQLNYTIKLKEYQTLYFASVRAIVKNFDKNEEIQVYYNNVILAPNNYLSGTSPGEFLFVLVLAIILVIIIFLCISLLGRRAYKKTLEQVLEQKQIDDNIQDLDNNNQHKSKIIINNKKQVGQSNNPTTNNNSNDQSVSKDAYSNFESQNSFQSFEIDNTSKKELSFNVKKGYASLEDEQI